MKETYLKFPQKRVNYLPQMSSRRFPGVSHSRNAAYKDDGTDDDEQKEEAKKLLKKIEAKVTSMLETRATKDEIAEIKKQIASITPDEKGNGGLPLEALRLMADEKDGVMAKLVAQGLEITKLKGKIKDAPEDLSIRGQIKKWHESKMEGSGITVLESIRTKKDLNRLPALEFQMRVASPMTPSNTLNSSAYLPKIEYAPGINEIVRPQPTFWDFVVKGVTGSANYVWINKKNPLGAAAFIAPGVLKPGVSFEIETEISNAKKIAASEKIAMELLSDIDGFASWVEQELVYQVDQKTSLTLMSGVSSSTVPAGIQSLSVAFTGAALGVKTTNPNNWDVIRACVAQLRHANLKGDVVCFLNPIDYANMVMTKAISQGQLFLPPVTGATIVEDNNVSVGYFQIAIMQYYKILIYQNFTMTYGLENDDFTKNLVTVIGERRLHQFHSENFNGFAIYDQFANVIPAITQV